MQKANPLIRSDNNKSSPAIFQCSADHTSTPTLVEKPSGAIRGPSRAAVARRESIYRGDNVSRQQPRRLNKKDSIYFVTGPLSGQPGVYLYHLKLLVFTQPSFSFWGGKNLSVDTVSATFDLRPAAQPYFQDWWHKLSCWEKYSCHLSNCALDSTEPTERLHLDSCPHVTLQRCHWIIYTVAPVEGLMRRITGAPANCS